MAKKRIPKKVAEVVAGYTQRLSEQEKLPIKRVIVFGSQVKGRTHKSSDIDVCIISPRFKDILKSMQFLFIKRNRKEVLAGLEPIGFTEKDFKESSCLIEEIKKTGVEL